MTNKYYIQDSDFSFILDFFKNQISVKDNEQHELIKGKIKELNDNNFFKLLRQIITLIPIKDMKNEELSFFFKEKIFSHFVYDYSGVEEESLDTYSKIFNVDYVKLNCKLKIYKISERILKARKLPIHILETELFTLKDFIISENLSNLDYVLNSFDEYLKTSFEYENYENILISMKIVEAINTHKYNLINYLDQITLKLEYLYSKTDKSKEKSKIANNYNLDIDNKILYKLYNELERNEFIDAIETSFEQFVEVLKKDWHDHKSVIHLKMDNIQLNFFLLNLKKHLNIKLFLSKVEFAGNIYNKNGKLKAYSISASYSESLRKGTEPKRKKDIISIFEKFRINKKD